MGDLNAGVCNDPTLGLYEKISRVYRTYYGKFLNELL
jgi:hypothetical protein